MEQKKENVKEEKKTKIYKEKWRGRENQKQKKEVGSKEKVKKTTHTEGQRENAKDGRMEGQEGEGDLEWWVLEVFM